MATTTVTTPLVPGMEEGEYDWSNLTSADLDTAELAASTTATTTLSALDRWSAVLSTSVFHVSCLICVLGSTRSWWRKIWRLE